MFKIALNLHKPYNYAFFCPVSKLHLTVSNPVGYVHEVTSAICSGIKGGTLIDVDGIMEQSKGKKKYEEPVMEPTKDEPAPVQQETTTGRKKRGQKQNTNDLFNELTEEKG